MGYNYVCNGGLIRYCFRHYFGNNTRATLTSTGRYSRYAQSSYDREFALFRFHVGSLVDYGWLELSLQNGFDTGPIVDVLGYAYDTSGKPIKAGAISEPARLPLALGALALGAVGVREWRAKRKPSATGEET